MPSPGPLPSSGPPKLLSIQQPTMKNKKHSSGHFIQEYTRAHTPLLIKNLPSKSEDHHVPSCCLVPVGTICPLLPLQTAWFLAGPQMCSTETCSTCLVTHPYHSACSHLLTPARSSSLWRRMLTEASFSLSTVLCWCEPQIGSISPQGCTHLGTPASLMRHSSQQTLCGCLQRDF